MPPTEMRSDGPGDPPTAPGHGTSDRPSIAAVLAHDRNRELLREWLDVEYDVVTTHPGAASFADDVRTADLLLLDAGAYEGATDWIADYREQEASLFRPVLLLVSDRDAERSPSVWEHVDDVVAMPVEQAVLDARIRGVLSRRELSRQVAASEDRFRTLFETSPDATMLLAEDGRILDANAAFRELLDVTQTDIGRLTLDELAGFDEAAIGTIRSLVLAEDADLAEPVVAFRTPGGERRHLECRTNEFQSAEHGGAADPHCVVVLRDITDRVERQAELERQVDRLDEFAGILAHEMRNPLSIASGYLDHARETGDPDAYASIQTAHERMNGMIDELLELARQGKTIGDVSLVVLGPLVQRAWDELATGDATLEVDGGLEARAVAADPRRLHDLFTNLFRNAIEHGGSGVAIEVGVTEDEAGVYVQDDGAGLGDADPGQLFEPGYTTAETGTGFGLSIVDQIATAHGWSVHAEASPSGGARFEILDLEFEDELPTTPEREDDYPATPTEPVLDVAPAPGDDASANAFAEAVLDTLPSNIAVIDSEGRIVQTNHAWRAFASENAAKDAGAYVGVNYLDTTTGVDDEHSSEANEGLRAVLDGERETFTLEYPCHSPDEERWFLMRAVPFTHTGQRYVAVQHTDITERKLAELEVQARVEDLAIERDRLALLNQVVRHDIRNDMMVVLGWSEQLEPHVAEEGQRALGRVRSAATHTRELTDAVRDLAETVGISDPDLQAVSLTDVLRSELRRVDSEFDHLATPLSLTDPDAIPEDVFVLATPLLSSVFGNLLANAVFHNDADRVDIDVDVETTDETVRVRVADNGPGIHDDQKESVFGRGEKGLESTGSGLGLYLVSELVEAYGGDVWVEDAESGGAAFVVELQRA